MTELLGASAAAFWLGLLAAMSPCPLATNIAAVSYLGKDLPPGRRLLAAGTMYALGRMVAYVAIAALIVSSVLSIPAVASFLQGGMGLALGPVLIVIGAFVLGWIPLPALVWAGGTRAIQDRAARRGLAGAALLGLWFALSFCPVSAGLFFGSLMPLSVGAGSRVLVPASFGLGTGLPVVAVAVLFSMGARRLGRLFEVAAEFERWGRWSTGLLFVALGAYFTATRNFGFHG